MEGRPGEMMSVNIPAKSTEKEGQGAEQDNPHSKLKRLLNSSSSKHEQWLGGRTVLHWLVVALSSLALVVGTTAASLLGRFYFVGGGSRKWLYSCTMTAAWPLGGIVLSALYWREGMWPAHLKNVKLMGTYAVIGFVFAVDNLFYSWGMSYLSVSTSALLSSSHLVFNAIFAYILVGERINAFTYNSIMIITSSAITLGLDSASDNPPGVSKTQYTVGFAMMIASSAVYGLLLPLEELVLRKFPQENTSLRLALEIQTMIGFFATLWLAIGMSFTGDFPAMLREAKAFHGGEVVYYVTVVGGAVGWELALVGTIGVICLISSLYAAVLNAATIPLISLLAVIFFHDNFGGIKAMAMVLALWAFFSYIYGGHVTTRKQNHTPRIIPLLSVLPSHGIQVCLPSALEALPAIA